MRFLFQMLSLSAALLIILMSVPAYAADEGSRPRNVAVSPDGATIIATSGGSEHISIVINDGPVQHYRIGAPTWGVTFLHDDNLHAVITVPSEDRIVLLTRTSATGNFIEPAWFINGMNGNLEGCTEIIADTRPSHAHKFFVACRGKAPLNAEPWQHAIYEMSVSGSIDNTYVSERQPRALALSPDGDRLFVGTVQGALGGPGLAGATPWPLNSVRTSQPFDGGSIVSYDTSTANPELRFAIGSPVRGIAILDLSALPSSPSGYRMYFTHVGDGAQSEDPNHGGLAIPNVVSSIRFTEQHAVSGEAQHVVFNHLTDLDVGHDQDPNNNPPGAAVGPAVLPERIAFRLYEPLPEEENEPSYELWVSFSGSGTIGRAFLDTTDGSLTTMSGAGELLDLTGEFDIVTGRDPLTGVVTMGAANPLNAIVRLNFAAGAKVWSVGSSATVPNSSNPRGLVYDSKNDRLLAVTQFDHELVVLEELNGATTTMSRVSLSTDPSNDPIQDERDFFTASKGFVFRENLPPEGDLRFGSPVPPVDNTSCGTCHVDGHLDAKVRLTVRTGENVVVLNNPAFPVTVPSVFDVSATEWIFFEGLRTIRDNEIGTFPESCQYCATSRFFDDTIGFTNQVASPPSPYAQDLGSTSDPRWGRAIFDRLNCGRCHSNDMSVFERTQVPVVDRPFGPLNSPNNVVPAANLLHDPTQSFVTSITPIDNVSLRNMTNVGTRETDATARIKGVNTPSLAGAWDNGPYMHDGRYRTLEEVLDHTHVNAAFGHRSVPRWSLGGRADNLTNMTPLLGAQPDFMVLALPAVGSVGDEPFKTHQHSSPAGPGEDWTTLGEYFDSPAEPHLSGDEATAYLAAYLRVLSSQQDPCLGETLLITNFDASVNPLACTVTLTWNTSTPTSCSVQYGPKSAGPLANSVIDLPVGIQHSLTFPMESSGTWKAQISAGWCGQETTATKTWSNIRCLQMFASGEDAPKLGPGMAIVAPNPFNPRTEISFALTNASPVTLRIYDNRGRLVLELVNEQRSPGTHRVIWDGDDGNGAKVGAGVYHMQLRMGGEEVRKRLVLVK